MNERIKELVHEASDFMSETANWSHLTGSHNDIFHAKFAELIVRECARCVTQPTIQAARQTEFSMKALQDVLANDMKAYFGVE